MARMLYGHGRGGGRSAPYITEFLKGSSGAEVGLERSFSNSVVVWSQIKEGQYVRARLSGANAGTRLSWVETLHCPLKAIYPVNGATLSGTFTELHTRSDQPEDSYVGGYAVQTQTLNDYAEFSVTGTGTYDLWVTYTGRTLGAYCRVNIDGAQTLVNEIDDPASLGFKAFTTTTASDLTRRQQIKVASGLTGSHTVRLVHGGNDGGNRMLIEGVAITGTLSDSEIMPPVWQASTAYKQGQEVQRSGIYYRAATSSTSDAGSGPTHTTGIASDGTMDWYAFNRTSYQDYTFLDYTSEKEYAFSATISAVTEDIGGQVHGNETLGTRSITVDGVTWSESSSFGVITSGAEVLISEDTTWTHSQDATLASVTLDRTYTPGTFRHQTAVTITTATVDLGYAYPGMRPFVRWDGVSERDVFTQIHYDSYTLNLADYSGVSGATAEVGEVYRSGATGTVNGFALGWGIQVSPESLDTFQQSSGKVFVFPNQAGGTATGSTTWYGKEYFRRASDAAPETFVNTNTISMDVTYTFREVIVP